MKPHGLGLALAVSALLLGGCTIPTVQIKSAPAEAARLRSVSDKTYTLVLDGKNLPAEVANRTISVARTTLAEAGYREMRSDQPAHYRIRLSVGTRTDGSIPFAYSGSRYTPGQYVYTYTPTAENAYRYADTTSVPATSSNAVYVERSMQGQYTYVPPRASTSPENAISTGKSAYAHVVKVDIDDLQAPGSPAVWTGVASIRNTDAKLLSYIAPLTSAAIRNVGKPSSESSPLVAWAAAWFEAP